ncbi:hypothetical protein [Neolewinella sp.]|uniref:hypothetical protein n=1 Tax=Neolewinella sp. TaxID=2993543 RepID=UPI003B527DA7
MPTGKSKINYVDELLSSMTPPGVRQADSGRIRKAIITAGDSGIGRYSALALGGTNITINGVHPAEIASMVRYLASDEAQYINGISYDVDGGFSVGGPMVSKGYQKVV